MAYRVVYSLNELGLIVKTHTECEWKGGTAKEVKRVIVKSIHENFLMQNIEAKILEVSTASENPVGVEASALNLTNVYGHKVESVYQGSKVFTDGGPYTDLYTQNGYDSKTDLRLKSSGQVKVFRLYGRRVLAEPITLCYNWIYCSALHINQELVEQLMQYDAFSDVYFNHNKGVATQAEAVTIYLALKRAGVIDYAMQSLENFERIVYKTIGGKPC